MQIITIFKKECRQQGVLALAMLLLCFFMQLAAFIMVLLGEIMRNESPFFAISMLMTALFAGSAAAISFAGEHDDKTFGFLRSLPVTPMTVMLGKTAWLVCITITVFVASSLLALFWGAVTTNNFDSLNTSGALGSIGIGIIEAFVWGLFWSPRCRSQIHALLATYFCASAASYFSALLCSKNVNIVESYCNAVPLRVGITAIVAVFAVRGALKWFDRAVQKNSQYAPSEHRSHFRYPKYPQSPFFALLYQSVRQSSTILLYGVGVIAYFCCTIPVIGLHSINSPKSDAAFFGTVSLIGCFIFFIVFSGSIFSQDQKNNSFRFLSRCGISARKVWWSRILPFFIISLPSIVVFIRQFHFETQLAKESQVIQNPQVVENLWPIISMFVSVWLIPFAVGAFISIYCRSMMVSIALTGAVSAFILLGWMMTGIMLCGLNPIWTTLPICASLIIASRLRTADWLRERDTWKSRLIPLLPLCVTVIAILAAVPPARIYSIDNPSLDEIEALLNEKFTGDKTSADSHKIYLHEALSPEERKILFQETAASFDKPFTEQEWRKYQWDGYIEHWSVSIFRYRQQHPDRFKTSSPREIAGAELDCIKQELARTPMFEVWLLNTYASQCRAIKTGGIPLGYDPFAFYMILYRCLPWEKARALRMLNDKLRFDVLQSIKPRNAPYYGRDSYYSDSMNWRIAGEAGLFDSNYWFWNSGVWNYYDKVLSLRARLVILALKCWYLDHDNTLPDSLDELVGTYLDEIPVEPLTGVAMKYIPKPDDKDEPRYDHKPGWAYIQIGNSKYDLYFLPGYKEDKNSVGGYYGW
jgi:hypothetical protein